MSLEEFDQSTYFGRFRHFCNVTDFRTLFTTREKLDKSLNTIKEFESKSNQNEISKKEYFQALKIKNSMIHPDTGKIIPLPLRFAAFVPVNICIVAGMLAPTQTTTTLLFWQWANQSYNVALNHANRNASNELSNFQIAGAYGAAVASSCTAALGLNHLAKKVRVASPFARRLVNLAVPYTAVCTAGILNVVLMRGNELTEGIQVKDKNGAVLGKSPIAGKSAITQVAISRIITPLPAVFLPGVVTSFLTARFSALRHARVQTPLHLGVIALCLQIGLPTAIAMFPQTASMYG